MTLKTLQEVAEKVKDRMHEVGIDAFPVSEWQADDGIEIMVDTLTYDRQAIATALLTALEKIDAYTGDDLADRCCIDIVNQAKAIVTNLLTPNHDTTI